MSAFHGYIRSETTFAIPCPECNVMHFGKGWDENELLTCQCGIKFWTKNYLTAGGEAVSVATWIEKETTP